MTMIWHFHISFRIRNVPHPRESLPQQALILAPFGLAVHVLSLMKTKMAYVGYTAECDLWTWLPDPASPPASLLRSILSLTFHLDCS